MSHDELSTVLVGSEAGKLFRMRIGPLNPPHFYKALLTQGETFRWKDDALSFMAQVPNQGLQFIKNLAQNYALE